MSARRRRKAALACALSLACGLYISGARIGAKPPYDPPRANGASPWSFYALGFVNGVRYRPPTPPDAAGAPTASETTTAPGVQQSAAAHQLGLAFWIVGVRAPRQTLDFTYHVEALAGAGLGRIDLRPHDAPGGSAANERSHSRGDSGEAARFVFAPGDNFHVGATRSFSETTRSSALLGRFALRDPLDDRMLGAHGALTGLHLRLEDSALGELVFTPLHRPSLAGDAAPGANADELWRRKLVEASERRHDVAHRIGAILRPGELRVAAGYEYARLPAPEGVAAAYRRSAYDRIERASLGLGYARRTEEFDVEAYLAIERVQGERRSLLFNDANRPETRIAGHALFAGLYVRRHGWLLGADFFLPEPPVQRRGSAPGLHETSGYFSYGRPAIAAPILARMLFVFPAPHLPRREAGGAPTDAYSGEWEFRNPAGTLATRLGYKDARYAIELQAAWLHPLADRAAGGAPFRTLRRDPEQPRYLEVGAEVKRNLSRGAITLSYSRLYRRPPGGRSETAAEFLSVAMQLPLEESE